MTDDEILDSLLQREGGFRAQVTRPDGSVDPDTNWGVTAPEIGSWLGLGRAATTDEVKAFPQQEARAFYRARHIERVGFTVENIPYEPLRIQLIDFSVNSGSERAIRWLQRVLGLPTTGQMNEAVVRLLLLWNDAKPPTADRSAIMLVNDALVAARLYMIDRAVDQGRMRKVDEEGVESRALEFFLARP